MVRVNKHLLLEYDNQCTTGRVAQTVWLTAYLFI